MPVSFITRKAAATGGVLQLQRFVSPVAGFMLGQCPGDMFADQVGWMVAVGVQGGQGRGVGWRIAQSDGDVAQPALMADASDRRPGQPGLELILGPMEQIGQFFSVQAVAHGEIDFPADSGEAVPRADELTVVAAVDPIAEQWPEFRGDASRVLYGQVGNAAARIEAVGRDNGSGRAGADTGAAGSAVPGNRRIGRQRQIGVDLSEKEPGAGGARQQQRVFAAPAQAGLTGQCGLHDRRRVDEYPIIAAADVFADPGCQFLQARAE